MMRTQIQLPDAIYHDAKRIAKEQEISLAEVVRRGLAHMSALYPPARNADWTLPDARALGPFAEPVTDWRDLANSR